MYLVASSISQFKFVWIWIPTILLLISFVIFLLLSTNKNTIKASDGTVFATIEEKDKYEIALGKIKKLFDANSQKTEELDEQGFSLDFINILRDEGFKDANKIMKYRNYLSKLVKIIYSE